LALFFRGHTVLTVINKWCQSNIVVRPVTGAARKLKA